MAFNKSPIDVSNLCEIVISKQLKGGLLDSIVMLILRGLADYEIDLQVQSKKKDRFHTVDLLRFFIYRILNDNTMDAVSPEEGLGL